MVPATLGHYRIVRPIGAGPNIITIQTAKDLRNDLRALKEDLDTGGAGRDRTPSHVSQTAVLPASVPRVRSAAWLALGAVVVLAVAGGWWYAQRPAPTVAPAFSTITTRRLTNTGTARVAAISPDGRYVVHDDGSFDKPGPGFGATWAPGGQALEDLVLRDGAVNLWRFPLDGSAPRAVTTFPAEQIMNYRWSRDGKTLAMSRGTQSADVVLITSGDANRRGDR